MKAILIIGIFLSLTISTFGQLKELTLEDAVLGYYKGLYPKSLNNIQWVENTSNYCFVKNNALEIYNSKSHELLKTISLSELQKTIKPLENFPYIESINEKELVFRSETSIISYNYVTKKASYASYPKDAENLDFNSSIKKIAFTQANNLAVSQAKMNISITNNKDKNIVSGQAIHRFEFGISKGTFWSPSGKQLAFYQKDETNVADYPLLDINTTPGSLKSIKYPMAGQKSEHGKVGVYNLLENKTVFLETGKPLEHYLTNLTWSPDGKSVFLAEVNRNQNHMWLNQYDAKTGEKIKTLFEEKNDKWVEPEHGLFFFPNNSNEFLWLSEKDGFMNIYHYNLTTNKLSQLTAVKWVIDDILGFDQKGDHIVFIGTGEDPRELHAFSLDIKTKKIVQLTKEEGVHHVQYNKTANSLIDSYSNLSTPKVINIVNLGKKVKKTELLNASNPLVEHKYGTTELVTLRAKTGENLHGRIIKPHDFDASKKYPVLIYVYGGPHAQLVNNEWMGGSSLWMYWMAEQGYVIFTLDGRGSQHRGFAFESEIHRHLGDLEVEDQMTGVQYLKQQTFIDSKRIAVHGWSFGGFMTTSLMLKKPGVFTTGVAGGPVIDWKYYEIMYGERYMDMPQQNEEGYKNANLLNYVTNLEGKLLMIHGTSDDVVVMQHNLKFVQKCISEGVQMDFFPYPMHPHNVRGKDRVHLMTKVLNYILDNNK